MKYYMGWDGLLESVLTFFLCRVYDFFQPQFSDGVWRVG